MISDEAEEGSTSDTDPDLSSPPAVATAEAEDAGMRLDQMLALRLDPALGLSRSRLRKLIEAGAACAAEGVLLDPAYKVKPGLSVTVTPPPPAPIEPQPEALALAVVYEDADLIVVDKPAGMAAHPAPGSETGTLVNALLHHCGDSLSGVGGALRPGIVHRIDKETSGLLVVAKSDRAHQGLSAQFAAHSIDRAYLAVAWGAPDRADPRLAGLDVVRFEPGAICIDAALARHPTDRKRMAVARAGAAGARRAVTRLRVEARFGAGAPVASALTCRLETGRTHQIRAHLAHIGHPIIGDPVYGRPRAIRAGALPEAAVAAVAAFGRQALHARRLGFQHPVSGESLAFESPPPSDIQGLLAALGADPVLNET